jgi:pilus assembly protein CpaB
MRAKRKKIIIAVLCGLAAALLMACYASMLQSEADNSRSQAIQAYGGDQVEIYVASRDIAVGERLTSSNVTRRVWLSSLLPAGALSQESEVIGQTLVLPLLANEPVLAAKLGSVASPISVPDGYCAVSIATNDVLAVGGSISAGSVIAIYSADKEGVELLATDVLVLATSKGNQASSSASTLLGGASGSSAALSWVTLLLPEDEVETIIAYSRAGNLYLVMAGGAE